MNKQRLMELAGVLTEGDGPYILVTMSDGYYYAEGPFPTGSAAHAYKAAWLKETGEDEGSAEVVLLDKPTKF